MKCSNFSKTNRINFFTVNCEPIKNMELLTAWPYISNIRKTIIKLAQSKFKKEIVLVISICAAMREPEVNFAHECVTCPGSRIKSSIPPREDDHVNMENMDEINEHYSHTAETNNDVIFVNI